MKTENGKLAVVTGGANGIGSAAAKLLAANGAPVCIFDREAPREDIGRATSAVDVTQPGVDRRGVRGGGTPDIVMANAGVAEEEEFLDHSVERWERILAINLERRVPHGAGGGAADESAAQRSDRDDGVHELRTTARLAWRHTTRARRDCSGWSTPRRTSSDRTGFA